MTGKEWICIECETVLGSVVGGELVISDQIPGDHIRTNGPNLVIQCPACERTKTWYTSDQIVRAIYQLVDAITTAMATRIVRIVGRETSKM